MYDVLTAGTTALRRWHVADAEALDAALRANLEHLRPWMSWIANEPLPLDRRRIQIAAWEERFDAGEKYGWGIWTDGELIGACDVERDETAGRFVIGYWVDRNHLGLGHGARAARLITNAAFAECDAVVVSAVCDAANAGSNGVLSKLGFTLERVFAGDIFAPGETGRVHVYERTEPIPD